jgi:class 3 adenylate cyclase
LLVRRLRQQGFEVDAVEDGTEALRRLRGQAFDLLLLDVIMPGPDGDQILAQIKEDVSLRALPVIMLSALDEMDSVVRCILSGAEDYLAKPVNTVLLRARIEACLEKSRLRRQEESHLRALESERHKSESLLRNILPAPIAERLKRGETTIVDSLPEVTVLFADLVGFTEMSARTPSVEVVRLLDDIFSQFDALAEAQGLEKIKTIGDAYMVVGGLPTPRPDHAEAVAEIALNMVECIDRRSAGFPDPIRIRLGIDTGPVIAGIIGRSKFSYDLWGDTVNMASRMESLSIPGRIQVTEEFRRLLEGRYRFEFRGEMEVKGRGVVPAWFLTGRAGS